MTFLAIVVAALLVLGTVLLLHKRIARLLVWLIGLAIIVTILAAVGVLGSVTLDHFPILRDVIMGLSGLMESVLEPFHFLFESIGGARA